MFKQQKQAAWFVEKKIPAFSVLTHLNIMPLTFGALLFCVFFSWVFSNNEAMPCILLLSSFT